MAAASISSVLWAIAVICLSICGLRISKVNVSSIFIPIFKKSLKKRFSVKY
jgi:hypothetical protein